MQRLRASAANLKFLIILRQTRLGTSNSKAALEINKLLVHLCFRSSQTDVPQWDANFGIGALISAAIVALVTMVASTMLQAVSVGNAPLAVLANASGALVACLYVPVLGTAIYNQAKRSPCTLRFHIASEAGWDLGGASALLVAAGLLQAGMPIGTCILLSLLGAMASFYLLRTYFSTLEPAA